MKNLKKALELAKENANRAKEYFPECKHIDDVAWQLVQEYLNAQDREVWSENSDCLIGKTLSSPELDDYRAANIIYLDEGGFVVVDRVDTYVIEWDAENTFPATSYKR